MKIETMNYLMVMLSSFLKFQLLFIMLLEFPSGNSSIPAIARRGIPNYSEYDT